MLSTHDAETIMNDSAAEPRRQRDLAPLAVPPLTILLLVASAVARSPSDVAIAALSLLALARAAVAFAASNP